MDEILTIEQVAALLSCETGTVAEHLKAGLLPGLKFGRHWVLPAQSFFEHVNALACEQAAARRAARLKSRIPLAHHVPTGVGGKPRRVPPVLPSLTDPVQ